MGKKSKEKARKERLFLADSSAPFGYVEAYKNLRTNLEFMLTDKVCKKIVITSTLPDEQKTGVSVNLALVLAESGKRVCLVDCDLRRPMHHKLLHLGHHVDGLTMVLAGQRTLDETLRQVDGMGFWSLPCGHVPPDPSELLGSEKMAKLVEDLSQEFDYILFDTPPAAIVTDAVLVGRLADGVMLVVRQNFADKRHVLACKEKLEQNGLKVLGTVLTGFNMKKAGAKSGGYGNYYYAYSYKYKYSADDEDEPEVPDSGKDRKKQPAAAEESAPVKQMEKKRA